MQTTCLTRSATSAIAAALALTLAPAATAATTAPLDGPIVNIPPVSAESPAETTTVPTVAAPVMTVADVPAAETQAIPAPAAAASPAPRASARSSPSRATTTAAAQPAATRPVQAADAPVTPDPEIAATNADEPLLAVEDDLTPVPLAADPQPAVAPTPEQTSDVTRTLGLILLGLVGLVVAVFVVALLRRRRRAAPVRKDVTYQTPARTSERALAPRSVARRAEAVPVREPIPAFDSAPSRALASEGAAVALPARVPETFEERDALLKRMMDAPPDRANPFTNRRARLHRARLILQSLDRSFESNEPWIDLTDYPNNWPVLARKRADARAAFTPAPSRELEPA